ncbi:MAG: DNA-processing protein DprA [bacterium]
METVSEIWKLKTEQIPKPLFEIPEPPKELYAEGNLPWEQDEYKYLTVVGSRKFSTYGRDACEKLIAGLAGYPIVIISGLALGIDTIAHKAALKARLTTIAVPGSGLERSVLHPHTNKRLADDVVSAGGCLLSEYEPLMPAGVHTFPRRNRIIAGMSDAVLVIEAGEKSGTLITARLATEYNRDCLAVPGSIFSPSSTGANWLITQGATPITSSEDVLNALHINIKEEQENKQQKLFADLSPQEKVIIDLIASEPITRDEIIMTCELSTSEINTLLMTMEIKGLIKEEMGEIRLA